MLALGVMVVGSVLSAGRGGWAAGMAGLVYIAIKARLRREFIVLAIGAPVLIGLLYFNAPVFQRVVDYTFARDNRVRDYSSGVGGVDDGGRFRAWREGAEQLNSPFWGSGFFHRGGSSGLVPTGSHNFFLQMFMETGIFGGALMLAIFYALWHQAGCLQARRAGLDLPAKAALVAALTGGLSGEYFYGGIAWLVLLGTFAACGSLPPRLPGRTSAPLPMPTPPRSYYAPSTRPC